MCAHFIKFLTYTFMIGALFVADKVNSQSSYSINWFTDSDGLPQNSVKDVFPDKYGYVWLSTENGMVRYDGLKFKLFNNDNIPGVVSNRMWFFEGSPKTDSLFTFNSLGEVILINKRVAKKVDKSLFAQRNFKINDSNYIDFDGMISAYHFMAESEYIQLYKTNKDYFRIGNDTIQELLKNGETKTLYHYPIEAASQFFLFRDRLYVLDSNKNLLSFVNEKIIRKSLDETLSQDVTIYTNDVADQVFIYDNSVKNLYFMENATDTIKTKLVLEGFDLKTKQIRSIYYDVQNEVLYLGSMTEGLCIIKKNYFKNILTDLRNNDNVEYAMTAINDSVILTASGAYIQNKSLIGKVDINNLSNKYYIIKDENGDIWAKRGTILYKFKKQHAYKKYDSWGFDSNIVTLFLDEKNTLWVGTETIYNRKIGALFSMNISAPDFKIEKHTELDFKISCILKHHDGNFLIGGNNGFYILDPRKKQSIKKIKSIGTPNVRSIHNTGKDVWITSYDKGFFLYSDKKVTTFPLDKNKFLATTHCIVEDHKGFFWITTNKGLFQVSKQALYDFAEGKIDAPYYHYYDKSYGFVTNEFNGGCDPCGVILPNQQIYVPSLSGVVTFNASEIKPIPPKGDIYLDEVEIDGSRQFIEDHIQVDRNFGRITFYISSPSFGLPYNNKIEMKLVGANEQKWTTLDQDGSISFTNLSPGKYTLTARKLLGFNSEYTYKTITLLIPPAFWQTVWFKVLIGILLLVLVYSTIKMRTRYIRHKNILLKKKVVEHTTQLKNTISALRETKSNLSDQIKNQKKLIRSITHDIKSPLKYLALTGQHIYENPDDSIEDLQENIKSIYTSSFQLYHFVDNLLDYTRVFLNTDELSLNKLNLCSLLNDKIALFQNIAQSRRVSIINNVSEDTVVILNKQFFSIIVHNLLDNAVKNTSNGKIVLDSSFDDKKFLFSIMDTGSGMDLATLTYYQSLKANIDQENQHSNNKGMGLKIIIEILIVMGGNIDIKSEKEKGTQITLSFRLK